MAEYLSLSAKHPEQLRLECVGLLSRGERRVYDLAWGWLTRPGAPRYLTLSREWLARQCRVSVSTVARAFARIRRLGLLIVKERWRRVGNLRRQVSNLLALPFGPAPERVNFRTHTRKLTKKTQNKEALRAFSGQNSTSARRGNGFETARTILERWAERGLTPQRP